MDGLILGRRRRRRSDAVFLAAEGHNGANAFHRSLVRRQQATLDGRRRRKSREKKRKANKEKDVERNRDRTAVDGPKKKRKKKKKIRGGGSVGIKYDNINNKKGMKSLKIKNQN